MGVCRREYVMVGVYVDDLPFDRWADENERYVCGFPDEPLEAIALSDITNDGWVIGRVLVRGDSDIGIKRVSFPDNLTPIRFELIAEIKEKLNMDVAIDDIKCYTFTTWS